jgi:hypothetical protein
MGEMLVLNPTGELRVMMAKSFSKVYKLKLGCLMNETGSILPYVEKEYPKGRKVYNPKKCQSHFLER